jgi:type III pantothenate kinase
VILAVDAGNSRIKWALHDGRQFTLDGAVALRDAAALDDRWSALPMPSAVVVANVAGEQVRTQLQSLLSRWAARPVFVAGVRSQCGVRSSYEDPSQLGPDRWAALIGARALFPGACVIANAGTAMTVDALTGDGDFLGGIIVPGFDLMHEALASKAARLSAARGSLVLFPRGTRDAITSGAIQALCGAIERIVDAMAGAGHPYATVVLSGGGAGMIAGHLGRPAKVVDKLVLEGLVRIAMEFR